MQFSVGLDEQPGNDVKNQGAGQVESICWLSDEIK